MTDTIRCPACRGAKKVPKLGGMIGECNTCNGEGTILAIDKTKPVIVETVESQADIINAVANALPVSTVKPKNEAVNDKLTVEVLKPVDTKIDSKKALYKRKTSAK